MSVYLIYCLMKTYVKNALPLYSPSNSTSDPISPTLADSKSTSNLYQSWEDTKKFRETSYLPGNSKNVSREFLRYTVNINKQDNNSSGPSILPVQSFRAKFRGVATDSNSSLTGVQESPLSGSKPNSAHKKYQKRSSNPQKKQQKQVPIPKFLQKKLEAEDGQPISKTDRLQPHPKKTFTPKCNKTNEDSTPVNKFNVSYSSSDLLKLKNVQNGPTREKKTGCKIQDFRKIKFLGEGRFGKVQLMAHKATGTLYALKQISKECIAKNKMQNQLLMQIKMQLHINHPNILKLYGVFNDEENIYLILQYMEQGTLYSQLKKKKVLKEQEASRKLRDILDGVAHLHAMNIAHRDIKPQNIVISHDVCKICDLGWAAICEDRRKTLCGTIDYACPQLLEGKLYGIAVDLWCLGVLCFQLTVGKCPFYHVSRKQTMHKIINSDLSGMNLPSSLSPQTRDFIQKMLKKNPEQRMSAQSALSHSLITKYLDEEQEELRGNKKN